MAVKLLQAGVQGNPTNSTGQDVADTVNAVQLWLDAGEPNAISNYDKITEALLSNHIVNVNSLADEVFISDTIVVPSNKSFTSAAGTTLKMVPSANKMVICNEGLLRAFSTATVAWLAADGRKFTVSWTAHGLSVGDGFCIQGATPVSWNTVYVVAEGTTTNTIVAFANKLPTAAPSGAANIKRLDKNTRINVSVDYNKAGGNNGIDMQTMASVFAFMQDSQIKIKGKDANKYISQISGSLNVDIDVSGDSSSDIMKFYGACRDIRGKVSGTSHDDCFSIQAKEPAAYIAYQPAIGSISGVTIRDFSVQQVDPAQNHSAGIAIYSDDVYTIDGVVIKDGSVSDSQAFCFIVRYGDGFTSTNPMIEDVTIKNVVMQAAFNKQTIVIRGKIKSLIVDSPTVSPSNSSQSILIAESASFVQSLLVKNWQYPSAQNSSYLITMQGSAVNVKFENCGVNGVPSNQTRFINVLADKAQKVTFDKCEFKNIGRVFNYEPSASNKIQVVMTDSHVDTCDANIYGSSTTDVILSGNKFVNITNGAVRAQASGATVRCFDYGNEYSGTAAMTAVTGGIIIPMTPTLPANLSATGFVKTTAGAFAFSTTAVGTIPANRPVVCNGTNWLDMTNLSNLF